MKNIFDIAENRYDYPNNDKLLNGVEINSAYGYVSSTYLNGFINYVNILCGAMVNAYAMDDEEWNIFCKNVDELVNEFHTDVSNADKFDEIYVLAESSDSYWIFDSDKDCSDCAITRISKEHFKDRDEAMASFYANIEKYAKECTGCDKIKLLFKEHFTGWITL